MVSVVKGDSESQRGFAEGVMDAVVGRGASIAGFLQVLVFVACVLLLSKDHPEFSFVFEFFTQPTGIAILATLAFWIVPLAEVAYVVDRIGAVRGQLINIAPYGLDLLPTLPAMLPHTKKVIDNIEILGPSIPNMMAPGVKEYIIPLMGDMMDDLDVFLPKLDAVVPMLPAIAPHMKDIMPYSVQLIPYIEELKPILLVDGWWRVNKHMDKMVPHIAKLAKHAKPLAKAMPEMLDYMDILVKYMDNLIEELDETVEVLDRVVPLLPLMPAADQAGLLNQKMAFKALPTVVNLVPLSNETTGKAAQTAANIHTKIVDKAVQLQESVVRRYQLYQNQPLAIQDATAVEPKKEK